MSDSDYIKASERDEDCGDYYHNFCMCGEKILDSHAVADSILHDLAARLRELVEAAEQSGHELCEIMGGRQKSPTYKANEQLGLAKVAAIAALHRYDATQGSDT